MLPDPTDMPLEPEAVREVPPPLPVPREPYWDYLDLAIVLGLLFAAFLLILLGAAVAVAFYPALKTNPTPLILPTQLALYGLIYLDFRISLGTRYGKPVFASLGWRWSRFNLIVAAFGGVILAVVLSGLATLLHTPKVESPIEELTKSPGTFVAFGIMAVTIAPLFEELFFRGFLQPLLSRSFGVAAGILITAGLFGALHAPEYKWAWQYGLVVALAGAVFGWVRAQSNSIVPSTVMHGCYNAAFVVALAVSKHT